MYIEMIEVIVQLCRRLGTVGTRFHVELHSLLKTFFNYEINNSIVTYIYFWPWGKYELFSCSFTLSFLLWLYDTIIPFVQNRSVEPLVMYFRCGFMTYYCSTDCSQLLFTNHSGTTGGIPLLRNCFSVVQKLVHIFVP